MNERKLDELIEEYVNTPKDERYGYEERLERKNFYQSFNYEKITKMKDEDVIKYLKKLWNVLPMAAYKMYDKNGHAKFKKYLANLLYGNETFEERYNNFHDNITEFKLSAMSEVLSYNYPDKFMIWNNKVKTIFEYLEIENIPQGNDNVTFEWYSKLINYGIKIKEKLSKKLEENIDLVDADYFYETIFKKRFGNKSVLGKIVDSYIETASAHIPKELYKWEAVKCFQENWNIDADDFVDMLKKSLSKAENLINAKNYFPKGMIIEFAKLYTNEVKEAFANLFNEKEKLESRYLNFVKVCDKILERNWTKDKHHYQDAHTISVYLTLMYPEKYFIYKPSISKRVLNNLGFDIDENLDAQTKENKKYKCLENYFKICNKLLIEIKKNNKLKSVLQEYIDGKNYINDDDHMLLQDILHYGDKYFNGNDENEEYQSNENDTEKLFVGKNIIYYGIPGCGKSFKVDEYAKKFDTVVRTVFHPDYTYTDFIGQLMPESYYNSQRKCEEIRYRNIPGPFTQALYEAYNFPEKNILLIIEEINRGNAALIFGDIFQLLDRNSQYEINNEFIKNYFINKNINKFKGIEKIKIPNNLTIMATMNTSDQNVYTLDTAFRRRFEFKRVENKFDDNDYSNNLKNTIVDGLGCTWEEFINIINEHLCDKNSNLLLNNEDKRLGAYSITIEELSDSAKFADKVLFYLWDNVGKYNDGKLFQQGYKLYDQIIDDFLNGKVIFCVDIDEKINKEESIENNE